MKFRYGKDELTHYTGDNLDYVASWAEALLRYSKPDIDKLKNSKEISKEDAEKLELHEREESGYIQRRENYSAAIKYIDNLGTVTDFIHGQDEHLNNFGGRDKNKELSDEAISLIFDFSNSPQAPEINTQLFEHLEDKLEGRSGANLAIETNYQFIDSFGPEMLSALLQGDDKLAVENIDLIRKLDALKNIDKAKESLTQYGIEVDTALMDKLGAYYNANKEAIDALAAKVDKASNIIYRDFGDDPFIKPYIANLFKSSDEKDVFTEEIKECLSYYVPKEKLIMNKAPEYSPTQIGKFQPEKPEIIEERMKRRKEALKLSDLEDTQEIKAEDNKLEKVEAEKQEAVVETENEVKSEEPKRNSMEPKAAVTGHYTKASFSALQNVFRAELEDPEVASFSDDEKKASLLAFFKNAGVKDELASDFIEQTEQLCRKLDDLGHHDNHGIPKRLEEDDYKDLKSDYDDLMKLCGTINSVIPTEIFEKEGSVYNKLQTALLSDIHIVNELADKHPDQPLELAFNNIKTRTISGSMAGANVVGMAQNKRAIITIVDDHGVSRTGVFTRANVVTDKMIVGHNDNTVNNITVDVLKMQKGERIDSRNSAMYDIANFLGRPDLIAPSMDIKFERNGQVIEGNFMEFINGTDLDHMTSDDPYSQIDVTNYISDSVKKDMLDLSIIDYLCLNVDRHSGNIIYQYGKDENNVTRLTGIKGIDNDSSFGGGNPSLDRHLSRIQPITSTVLITEAMAKKLNSMNHNTLELMLSKYNMNPNAIKAAQERLDVLQGMIKQGANVTRIIKKLQGLRDKKNSATITPIEEKKLNELEDAFKGFESDPIGFVQGNRVFNGNVNREDYKPGIIVIPDGMLKRIDFDAMGKKTTLKDLNTGRKTFHCGVIDNVTFEHNSLARKNFNMKIAKKNDNKQKRTDPNPELRIGGENINGAARGIRLDNSTMLFDLKKHASSSKDFYLKPLISEMTKLRDLSEKLGKEGYQPTDMEVNVLAGYMQSVKEECNKYMLLMGHKRINLSDPQTKDKLILIGKIEDSMEPMISRLRAAQERDLLAFNVEMAKEADRIESGRAPLIGDEYKDPEIESMLKKPVTSYDGNSFQYSYAINNIVSGNKKIDMHFADSFIESLKEIEKLSSELHESDKPAIGDIAKLRNAYSAALQESRDMLTRSGRNPAEKQMMNLASTIYDSLEKDKEVLDKLKPGDQRSFSAQYMDSFIKGRKAEALAIDSKTELIKYIDRLSDIKASRKKASPEFDRMVQSASDFLNTKDQNKLPDAYRKLEMSCMDYIAKHKGIAKNDLEQSCMSLAYGMRNACHRYKTAINVVQRLEKNDIEKKAQKDVKEIAHVDNKEKNMIIV